ncbi:hypothetical protein [Streptomyces sp. H39-S7]|uniref:hypothetical protein n=1 Tax=Streptomyces sp. H39-S7 TaxID=3004357 RepID=UPI0022AF95E4|nr:hypothetical protein [Streptomyces sp. H39-S7]MCZ4122698.1 hypothetical protein [Streptomyces sp. H39-S7]
MIIDPAEDATTLAALATACDTVRAQLPLDGPPYQDLDLVTVSRQLSGLGDLVTHLSDEVLFRSVQPGPTGSQRHRAIGAFASAVDPLGRAISALGAVYTQVAFRDETSRWPDSPNLRDALRPPTRSSRRISTPPPRRCGRPPAGSTPQAPAFGSTRTACK